MKYIKTFESFVSEGKSTFIEVAVRDAKKALEFLNDEYRGKFNTSGSNKYDFKKESDAYNAMQDLEDLDIEIINTNIEESVTEGKVTKRDLDKITSAVDSLDGIVGVKQHPDKKEIILVGYKNYGDKSKLKKIVQGAGYEYMSDGRSTNSPLFHSNWIAFKIQESVNESRDSVIIRNAIGRFNDSIRGYVSRKKLEDLHDQLARTIIDNVVGNGPVHFSSTKDNIASVVAKLEEFSDGSGKIKYDEDLIYAGTYMLESIQLEHHGKDWPEALLNMNLSDFLDKMKSADSDGYEKIEQIISAVKDDIVSAPVSDDKV